MEKTTAKDIVRSAGLSSEIEAQLTDPQDLDGDKLYAIFIQIKEHIGGEQANAFVGMVKLLDPLTTTNFLQSLYVLEDYDWDILLFNHYRNKTITVKNDFLRKLGWTKGPRELEKGLERDDER